MNSSDIPTILKQINENNNYKKIFINGPWGIGKSYYVNEYILLNNENFAYVSLFGKNTFDSIEDELAKELMKKLNVLGKGNRLLKKVFQNITGSLSYKGFSINTPNLARKGLIYEYSSLLESKSLIIVIDDLERKSGNLLIEDIMGMIEELSQFNRVKLVIIGDEKNMDMEDKKKWKKFKEKIIEKEYLINSFSDSAIENLIKKAINNYVKKDKIDGFINDFIKRHNVQNLRTIIKGINLFKEITDNYIKLDNKNVNLMVLKNCMSVAIETNEQIYKPSKASSKKNPFMYSIDANLSTRIKYHYFNSMYENNNDSCILEYVIRIYESTYNKNTIDELNEIIKCYLNIKPKKKENFYLSEHQISNKIMNFYNKICSDTYKYLSLDAFIDDFYQIVEWNDVLELNLDKAKLADCFKKILFQYYYDSNDTIINNTINRFEFIRKESRFMEELIAEYNKDVEIKYIDDKFINIVKSYKEKKYDEDLLKWLEIQLMQSNKKVVTSKFMEYCEKNNFFIPNLGTEISDVSWSWTCKIMKIFYERMYEDCKKKLYDYINTIKVNKLSSYRVNILLEQWPLIGIDN